MRSIRIPPPGPQRRMARTDIAAPSLNTLRLARAPFARRRTGVARPCWRSRAARLRHGTQGRRGRARRHPPSALPLACCPRAPRGGVRAPARACGTQGSAHTPRTQTCDSPQEPPRDVTVYTLGHIYQVRNAKLTRLTRENGSFAAIRQGLPPPSETPPGWTTAVGENGVQALRAGTPRGRARGHALRAVAAWGEFLCLRHAPLLHTRLHARGEGHTGAPWGPPRDATPAVRHADYHCCLHAFHHLP